MSNSPLWPQKLAQHCMAHCKSAYHPPLHKWGGNNGFNSCPQPTHISKKSSLSLSSTSFPCSFQNPPISKRLVNFFCLRPGFTAQWCPLVVGTSHNNYRKLVAWERVIGSLLWAACLIWSKDAEVRSPALFPHTTPCQESKCSSNYERRMFPHL